MKLLKQIESSIAWRGEAVRTTDAIRLFAGVSDGISGLLIEQFGPFLMVVLYNPELTPYSDQILSFLSEYYPEKSILIKARRGDDSGGFNYTGNSHYQSDAITQCVEDDSHFEIHLEPRHDPGLYLDTKAARRFVRNNVANKRVLNLFAYTCPFGVAASLGKAKENVNIDPSKEYLDWGRRNSELNGVTFKRYEDTTQDYLARHLRRLENGKDAPYDFIIVDPPAFLVGRGSNRLSRNLWPLWMKQLRSSLSPEFLFVINDKSLARKVDLESFLREGIGDEIAIDLIEQSEDVVGQRLSDDEDSFYFNPAVFHVKRVEN